jgi:glucose-1-phosphate adenylyltransferase
MGIYVFNASLLEKLLLEDARNPGSKHDFGRNIIPPAIDTLQVFAYPFTDVKTRAQNYWRDVGTVDAYYEANIELVHVAPELNLYDEEWPIWTYQQHVPSAKFILDEDGRRGMAINSIVSGACIISGAVINQSLLFSNVRVDERSNVFRAVVLPNVKIGMGCTIRQAILDEGCEVPDGMQIGVDRGADAARFHVTEGGVVLVTPEMLQRSAPGA